MDITDYFYKDNRIDQLYYIKHVITLESYHMFVYNLCLKPEIYFQNYNQIGFTKANCFSFESFLSEFFTLKFFLSIELVSKLFV